MIPLEFTVEQRVEMRRQTAQYKSQVNARMKRDHERFANDMIAICRKLNISPVQKHKTEFEEIQRIIHAQELAMRTCDLCGKACFTMNRMMEHRDSKACKQSQAEQSGSSYVDPQRAMVRCDICDLEVMQRNYRRHCGSDKHIQRVKDDDSKCYCKLCNITFTGRRAKRDLIKHETTSKRHMRKSLLKQGPSNCPTPVTYVV